MRLLIYGLCRMDIILKHMPDRTMRMLGNKPQFIGHDLFDWVSSKIVKLLVSKIALKRSSAGVIPLMLV